MAVQPGLGDHHAIGAFHEVRTLRPPLRLAPIAIDRHTLIVQRPQLRSPLARAVVPVAGGIAFFAVIALILWGIAALVSRNGSGATANLASTVFRPGSVERYAAIIDEDGPVLFPDLLGTDGDKSIVLDHSGTDPMHNWSIYLGHPADRPITCKVTQVRHTSRFTDCDGRTIEVGQLARPPQGVAPVVSADGILTLDLTPD
jgi:hypothetical protein